MKKTFQKVLIILGLCCCVLLTSCNAGIRGSDAKTHIEGFFDAIAAEDYAKAETFLHPERPADLEIFFLKVEEEKDLDFQQGIRVEAYTDYTSAVYDSTVEGSTYELVMTTIVGEKGVNFRIEIVKNDNGYGIYNLDLNT